MVAARTQRSAIYIATSFLWLSRSELPGNVYHSIEKKSSIWSGLIRKDPTRDVWGLHHLSEEGDDRRRLLPLIDAEVHASETADLTHRDSRQTGSTAHGARVGELMGTGIAGHRPPESAAIDRATVAGSIEVHVETAIAATFGQRVAVGTVELSAAQVLSRESAADIEIQGRQCRRGRWRRLSVGGRSRRTRSVGERRSGKRSGSEHKRGKSKFLHNSLLGDVVGMALLPPLLCPASGTDVVLLLKQHLTTNSLLSKTGGKLAHV